MMHHLTLYTSEMSSKGDLRKWIIYLLGNSYKVRTIMKVVHLIQKSVTKVIFIISDGNHICGSLSCCSRQAISTVMKR